MSMDADNHYPWQSSKRGHVNENKVRGSSDPAPLHKAISRA